MVCHLIMVARTPLLYLLNSYSLVMSHFLSSLLAFPYCCCSVARSCLTLWDSMDCSTPGSPVLHHLPEFAYIMSTESVVCREPAGEIPPMTRSCRETWRAWRVRSQGVLCLSIYSKTKICLFIVCCTILFWHYRGLSPTTFLWKKLT